MVLTLGPFKLHNLEQNGMAESYNTLLGYFNIGKFQIESAQLEKTC